MKSLVRWLNHLVVWEVNTPFNIKSLWDARYRILQLSGLSNKFPMALSDAFDLPPQKTCCTSDSMNSRYGQVDADLDGGR